MRSIEDWGNEWRSAADAAHDGKWSLDAFVRNIENKLVIVDESERFAPPLSNPGFYSVGFQSPRAYGVSIVVHF